MTRADRRTFFSGMAFISPWLFGFCIFTIVPVVSLRKRPAGEPQLV